MIIWASEKHGSDVITSAWYRCQQRIINHATAGPGCPVLYSSNGFEQRRAHRKAVHRLPCHVRGIYANHGYKQTQWQAFSGKPRPEAMGRFWGFRSTLLRALGATPRPWMWIPWIPCHPMNLWNPGRRWTWPTLSPLLAMTIGGTRLKLLWTRSQDGGLFEMIES